MALLGERLKLSFSRVVSPLFGFNHAWEGAEFVGFPISIFSVRLRFYSGKAEIVVFTSSFHSLYTAILLGKVPNLLVSLVAFALHYSGKC